MDNAEIKQNNPPQRLCSEIQLFELCDLYSCDYKTGRFCTNEDLISRFEDIAEDEHRPPERYIDEERDDGDEAEEEYDENYDDEYDDENNDEYDE